MDVLPSNVGHRFLGVDCFWALCMAFNVYLIFFHKYTVEQLRAMDWKYLSGCYGCSFVPAFVYIFVETRARGKVYGEAIVSQYCYLLLVQLSLTIHRYGAGSPPNGTLFGSLYYTVLFGKLSSSVPEYTRDLTSIGSQLS